MANLAGFQLGWLTCVLGGSLAGLVVVAGILLAHLRWQAAPGEWRWLAGFAALGLAIDGSLALAGGFRFPAEPLAPGPLPLWIGPLPLWLWLLWPLFATLLQHSLAWLWRHPWLAVAGGAVSGPLSYYAGAELADVTLAPWLLAAEALCWALLCLWLSHRLGRRGGFAQRG
nr:DUF2878 domain-containing protein [Halomonas organivorans]